MSETPHLDKVLKLAASMPHGPDGKFITPGGAGGGSSRDTRGTAAMRSKRLEGSVKADAAKDNAASKAKFQSDVEKGMNSRGKLSDRQTKEVHGKGKILDSDDGWSAKDGVIINSYSEVKVLGHPKGAAVTAPGHGTETFRDIKSASYVASELHERSMSFETDI